MNRMLRQMVLFSVMISFIASVNALGAPRETLDLYFLDMAGGASTLIVTPLGESVLIDTGSLEPMHRDADRILTACKDAGIERIDHLVTTHFDLDHYGAILEVSKRIGIGEFYDSGRPSEEHCRSRSFQQLYPLYKQATGDKVTLVKTGDDIRLKRDRSQSVPSVKLHCLVSDRKIEGFEGDIDKPVEGFEPAAPDTSENARSIVLLLTYGDFECYLGGDITYNYEYHMVRPVNRVGVVDLYQITHHGLDRSNNPVLLKALSPTVAIAMNGRRKGIDPRTFKALNDLPDLKGLYTIAYNTQYGDEGNPTVENIANAEKPEGGNYFKASVNHKTKSYTIEIRPEGKKWQYDIK